MTWERWLLKNKIRSFPGGPVVKISPSNAEGGSTIPCWGTKIPHTSQSKNQNIKLEQYYNKFNEDFKNGPHEKNFKKKAKLKSNKKTCLLSTEGLKEEFFYLVLHLLFIIYLLKKT